MMNLPEIQLGIVAVSRDCFPIDLSQRRRRAVVAAYRALGQEITEIETTIENENDTMKALAELQSAGVNALVVFLGNFGPEGPETLLAEKFDGPVMYRRGGGGKHRRAFQRPRRRLLRHAQRELQPRSCAA